MNFFQRVIDKFRNKLNLEQEMVIKKKAISICSDFETLILGTSCAYYGYRPNQNELNLAIGSQDLYTSYNLYKKLEHKNLKNIIISYSVFSQGFTLIRTHDRERSVWYKLLYGIEYQYPEIAKENNLYNKEKSISDCLNGYTRDLTIKPTYRGEQFQYKKRKIDKDNVKIVAGKHLKNNRREDSQVRYCDMLSNDTKDKNINVYIVIFPRPDFYRQFLPKKEELFKDIYDVCKKYNHVRILDYYDSQDYGADDFCDDSHLTLDAAVRFTDCIRKNM